MTGTEPRPADSPPTPPLRLILWGSILFSSVAMGVLALRLDLQSEPLVPTPAYVMVAVLAAGAAWWLFQRPGWRRPTPDTPVRVREVLVWSLDEAVAVVACVARLTGSSPEIPIMLIAAAVGMLVLHRPQG